MAFTEIELKYIDNTVGKLCRQHSPAQYQNELKYIYEVHRHDVSVWEMRPAYNNPQHWTKMGVAKFKYDRKKNTWKLYWMRRDMKWHLYDPSGESRTIERLVAEVQRDQYGAFFG